MHILLPACDGFGISYVPDLFVYSRNDRLYGAASVALRRKGFTISGLLVQLACPVLFFAEIFVESIISNLFY